MTNRAVELRQEPEEPRQATFLDLFLDLAFVFALFQLSDGLLAHLSWSGVFQTAVLLLAVWWVWVYTATVEGRYDPGQSAIQLMIIGSMFGVFVLAAAVPEAFSTRGLVFAVAYVAVLVGRNLFVLVTRGGERRPVARQLFWSGVSALPWLAGAFAQGWAREVLWALAVTVDYTVPRLGWPTPGLGRAREGELAFPGEYLAERQRQFFIIALGELIVVTGLAVTSSRRFGADREAAVVVAFATTVLLWRIYIYRAGEILGAAVAAASEPLRVGLSSLYAHPVMVGGLIAVSVGDELVITHPAGYIQPAWIAVILGGPALFLAGRSIFEYAVFSRVSPDRVIGILVLAAVSPVMVFAPPLLAALTAAVVLAGVAIVDTARARRHPDEPPSPRPGRARTAARASGRPRNDELLAGNWIRASNLRRFSELVSSYAGYRFDHPDWQAIQAGLDTVTSDKHTFSYPLTGQQPLTLTISKDPGSDEVSVQVTGRQDRLLGARIAGLTDAFQ
jgi:low temperature requirement protein LtrA